MSHRRRQNGRTLFEGAVDGVGALIALQLQHTAVGTTLPGLIARVGVRPGRAPASPFDAEEHGAEEGVQRALSALILAGDDMDAVPEAKRFIIQFSKMINMYTFDLQDKNLTSAGLVIRVQQCPQSVEKGFSLPRSGVLPVQFMNIV